MRNILKKAIVILTVICIAAALCVVFTACHRKDDDKLYVGLECAYAPFNYTQLDDENGAVPIFDTNYKHDNGKYANGYDVMIAKKIAEALGKELVVVRMGWDALIPAVNAGTVDFIIAGMSPTAERSEAIDFSAPYYQSNLVIVVRSNGEFASAENLNDFKGKNAKIVAQQGTFHDDALRMQGAQYDISRQTPLADFPAMINALNSGAVDGYIAEEPGALENCASNSNFTYIHLKNNAPDGGGFVATDADVAIAVGMKKGNSLREKINEALAAITQEQRDEMMQRAIALASGNNIEA